MGPNFHIIPHVHPLFRKFNGAVRHPLDPLSAIEVSAASAALKKYAQTQSLPCFLRFNVITLNEPTKQSLLAYDANPCAETTLPRQAFCILQTPPESGAIEAVVDLELGTVESWMVLQGVQPLATPDDCFDAEAIVKADPEVIALLAVSF